MVVVSPSQSRGNPLVKVTFWALFFLVWLLVVPLLVFAEGSGGNNNAPGGYLARISNDSPEEVADALKRAEELYFSGGLPPDVGPIALILHGPEVEIFFKDKYKMYKETVDLAARLSAFGVIDVRVCETQAGIMGRQRSSIQPFIGTVLFGPSEVRRLLDQQSYVYF